MTVARALDVPDLLAFAIAKQATVFWKLLLILCRRCLSIEMFYGQFSCAQVISSASRKRYQYFIDGELRTETSSFLGETWSADSASANFTICGVVERVGAHLELGLHPLKRCEARLDCALKLLLLYPALLSHLCLA